MQDPAFSTITLGIDIGRVIIGAVDDNGHADTSFLSGTPERALQTPPAPDAFPCIGRLVDLFGGAVWLVSKCGPRVQAKTRAWLDHWRFWDVTGVVPGNVRFCLERAQKARHCRDLAITHFIDDRLDVLEHLRGVVGHLYLFGTDWRARPAPAWAVPVVTWPSALATLERDVAAAGGAVQRSGAA